MKVLKGSVEVKLAAIFVIVVAALFLGASVSPRFAVSKVDLAVTAAYADNDKDEMTPPVNGDGEGAPAANEEAPVSGDMTL